MSAHVAVDLGAESGRVIRGVLANGRLEVEEVARFKTGVAKIDGHLRWDLPRFLEEIITGLRMAGERGPVDSIGVDSFGVDFGLLDEHEELIELPVAYRDRRTEGVAKRFFEQIPAGEIYARTGIQHLPFNTLFQLKALADSGGDALRRARHLLLIPDLVNHHLTGVRRTEYTNATTTQCFGLAAQDWDPELIAAAGVDPALFQEIVEPGTVLGTLRSSVQAATGLGAIPVIAIGSHDTASAVAAAPGEGSDWAFLSSGTWSLLGVESENPVLTDDARQVNFTNEGGVEGTVRLLTNIAGLWLLQRFRQDLGEGVSYADLLALARRSPADGSRIDPDDPTFLNPKSMTEALVAFFQNTAQAIPETLGAFVRCLLSSLADRYRTALDELRRVSGREINRLHVVGGGAKNSLLCQLTATAIGIPVIAGPAEATAIGNLLMQARARREIASLKELRSMVRASFPPTIYEPEQR